MYLSKSMFIYVIECVGYADATERKQYNKYLREHL